jgi:hypothetical protein
MLRGYCTSTVDESRSSPSSPRALSPARATLEPLIRLDRTPVISKHVHDLSNIFFAWTGGVPTSEVDLHYWIHSTSGPATASCSIPTLVCTRSSRQKTQYSTGVYGVVKSLPLGILCRSKLQVAGVAGHLGVQVPINAKATSPRFEQCVLQPPWEAPHLRPDRPTRDKIILWSAPVMALSDRSPWVSSNFDFWASWTNEMPMSLTVSNADQANKQR